MHSQCALLESRRTAEAQQKVDEEASTRALREAQAKITELTEQARPTRSSVRRPVPTIRSTRSARSPPHGPRPRTSRRGWRARTSQRSKGRSYLTARLD